jgi:hypothetical protein
VGDNEQFGLNSVFLASFGMGGYRDRLVDGRQFAKENGRGQILWLMPVIPVTWEMKKGGLRFQTRRSKKLVRPHLHQQTGHGGIYLLS